MADQASRLREQMSQWIQAQQLHRDAPPEGDEAHAGVLSAPVFAVMSGKGGVGKSNLCVNLALAFAEDEMRVLVIDADTGFADVEILFDSTPLLTLCDVVAGASMEEALLATRPHVDLLAGGSGRCFDGIGEDGWARLLRAIARVSARYAWVLVDCAPGVHALAERMLKFGATPICVVTPEPTAITDGYALLKWMHVKNLGAEPWLVVNRAKSKAEADDTASRLVDAAERFLKMRVVYAGWIRDDPAVVKSVMARRPLLQLSPGSPAASNYRQLARWIRACGQTFGGDAGAKGAAR
ncbi:AAA family ATPase [Alicyclobacillus mali]|uniref:AAA family ATPase n=1 Tax=Alicyclobacillus mali (ex Roth et al. 2021) TaxID=1123961 RepID=A0ABS0F1Q7_9BACL|nr:AAA family ATPase [Alicyclobacillus mali (ex Roth et al. 2021)]MBF8377223.1 AAA family ATPase [Alicyclobacillus mali (ex Roth et al. 2021)]MCL6488128.1 AAA family ATPase [Alicyclobacillus mali (ex Roth et al. 2021)]